MRIRLLRSLLEYNAGSEIDVDDFAGNSLIQQKIAEVVKSLDSPPQDKMMRDYPKKTNRNRKITSETMGTKRK
jgi:hypothetical protein